MKRWVDFEIVGSAQRGFEGAAQPTPIDKAAELVLSSTQHPITHIVVHYRDSQAALWKVQSTSETHVGGTGRTSRIDGRDA